MFWFWAVKGIAKTGTGGSLKESVAGLVLLSSLPRLSHILWDPTGIEMAHVAWWTSRWIPTPSMSNSVRVWAIIRFIWLNPLSHSAALHGMSPVQFIKGSSSSGGASPLLSIKALNPLIALNSWQPKSVPGFTYFHLSESGRYVLCLWPIVPFQDIQLFNQMDILRLSLGGCP